MKIQNPQCGLVAMQLQVLSFHRNGVRGTGFYSLSFTARETGEKLMRRFVATFESDDSAVVEAQSSADALENIIVPSCRVIDIDNPHQQWRGDEIALYLRNVKMEISKVY